jgi:hypothetical protein
MKHIIFKALAVFHLYVLKVFDRGLMHLYRHQFAECGEKVVFYPTKSDIYYKHIFVGNDVFIGQGASFMALVSFIKIGDHVQIAPKGSAAEWAAADLAAEGGAPPRAARFLTLATGEDMPSSAGLK